MCGITGYLSTRAGADETAMRRLVEAMATTLTHRGPDAGGSWADPTTGIALGHRRLSIQDLSAAGAQPMASPDGRLVLCYNGEIYNFRQLSRELEAHGHHFRGHSDTEVMLAAFTQWGVEGALQRFHGMFAFALWDTARNTLVLARDRVGKKPLYYGRCRGTLLFGSELKALRAHPDFDATVDPDALALYLQHSWVPGPRSIYRNIGKLPAGHWLEIGPEGGESLRCYWSAAQAALAGEHEPFTGDLQAAADALEAQLQDAIAGRMIADVSLGALLSGGYDSTTVTALMQSASSTPVKTFTIGFDDAKYDESDHARAIAGHLGTEHTELVVSPQDALDIIPSLPAMYDEPFADASQLPTFIVSKLARSAVTVALSGDGGDELFAGYGRYRRPTRDLKRWSRLPRPLRSGTAALLKGGADLGWRLLGSAGGDSRLPGWRRFPARLDKNVLALETSDPVRLFARQRGRLDNGADLVPAAARQGLALNGLDDALALAQPMQGMMLLDFLNYLVDDVLVKVDRASMAVALEVRAPFLDHRVVELAWRLPLPLRFGDGGGKRVMREVLRRYVPVELTDRPKKGFGVPVADWLRGPLQDWAADLLAPQRIREGGLLDDNAVATLWRQHQRHWADHSDVLWSLLMFQAWLAENG